MARTLNEAPITTRSARSKLPLGMHWRGIDPDVHLGYRRGLRGGRWVVRWYMPNRAYKQVTLGTADDALEPDGQHAFSFQQAVTKARVTVERERSDQKAAGAGPILAVADAVNAYIGVREAREAAIKGKFTGLKRDARSRLTKHVLRDVELSSTPLHRLTEDDLRSWLGRLPQLAPASVRRLVNDLKAALNASGRAHRARMPIELAGTIKEGLASEEAHVAAARKQVLTDEEIRRLIAGAWQIDAETEWGGDLARLVVTLAATGARFSQVIRMTVADVQIDSQRLLIPTSRKGRGTKRVDRTPFRVGPDVIAALRPAVEQRAANECLLERWRWRQVQLVKWVRDRRAPWSSAAEFTRPWAKIIARAGLSSDTVPYALRHSSIVRGLRAGLPTRLVAALHDTSSTMIERHYSRYIVDALDELSARAIIPLTADQS